MSAETKPGAPVSRNGARDTSRTGLVIVAALFALSAVAAFGVQTYFAFGFARHVWGLPGVLAWGPPIGLDLFIATLMAATYLLRAEPKKDLRTLWALTVVGILLQVLAAESFAHWRHMPLAGSLASFAPALMLAAILHTLIKVRRAYTGHPSPVMLAAPRWPALDDRRARALAQARGAAMRGPQPPKEKKIRRSRTVQTPRRGRQPSPDVAAVMAERGVGIRRAQQIVASRGVTGSGPAIAAAGIAGGGASPP
jgi:hypothetical protein